MRKSIIVDFDDTLVYTHRDYDDLLRAIEEETAIAGFKEEFYTYSSHRVSCYGYGPTGFIATLYERLCDHSLTIPKGVPGMISRWHHQHTTKVVRKPGLEKFIHWAVADNYRLYLYTKGCVTSQEKRVTAALGMELRPMFDALFIVPEKTIESLSDLVDLHRMERDQTWVVGDSLRSDIIPAINNGVNAVHIQVADMWAHEIEDVSDICDKFASTNTLEQCPYLIGSRQVSNTRKHYKYLNC